MITSLGSTELASLIAVALNHFCGTAALLLAQRAEGVEDVTQQTVEVCFQRARPNSTIDLT